MKASNLMVIVSVYLTCFLFADTEKDVIIKELSKIYIIENSVEKLEAYDKLAVKYGADGETFITPPSSKSKWSLIEKISPIDDSKTVIASLGSEEIVNSRYKSFRPSLVIRKLEGKFEAYITTDNFIGTGNISVTIRMDKNKAVTRNWLVSTDHKAMFHPDSKLLARVLTKTNTMVVRLVPYSASPITFSFDVRGFDKVIQKLK